MTSNDAIREVLATPVPDGTVLRADVARPATSDVRPVPALLLRAPYLGAWRSMVAQMAGEDPASPGLMADVIAFQAYVPLERALEAGFAVVAQGCRGTDLSDGTFRFYSDEAADGLATRQALAEQPWCDGRVLTFGHSYLTTTQLTAALASTEHLASFSTWVAPSTYDDDLAMRGGVAMDGPMYEWARQQVRTGLAHDGRPDVPQDELPEAVADFTPFLAHVGIREAARRLAAAHSAGAHVADWLDHPLHDAYWESVGYPEAGLRALDVPGLHVSGWYDLFQGGTLRNYTLAAAGPAGASQRLVIGPWTHLTWDGHLAGRDLPHGSVADGGLDDLQLDFWLASVGDEAATARLPEAPVRVYVMGADRWIDLPAWPAPDAVETTWPLSDGALLAPGTVGATGATSWVHDPSDPVPTQGGQMLMGGPEDSGPHDQRTVEARPDVAVLTSAPLDTPVTVLGPVRLTAWVSADATDAHLHAALTDVAPDGTSTLLTDGVLRLSARHGLDRRDPLTPGVPVEVEVDMWSTGALIAPGHRLRLDLAGSCWPRYGVADPADGTPVRITVLHDAEHPSALHLPVIDLDSHPPVR